MFYVLLPARTVLAYILWKLTKQHQGIFNYYIWLYSCKTKTIGTSWKNQLEICKSSLQMLFSFPLLFYCQFCNKHKEFYLLIRLIDLIDWLRHLVWLKSLMYQKFLLSNNSFFDMVHLIESIMDWRAAYYFKCWPSFYFVFDYGEWHSKHCY